MIYNEDCIKGSQKHLKDESVDLGIYDPPFGISESTFDKHYKRKKQCVLDGYVEAPDDYYTFSEDWMGEAKRILKPHGSMYIISGWTHLQHILNAADKLDLNLVNHIIWKFNFGVATKRKYVTSHYHILYLTKSNAKPKFNTYCRFGSQEKDEQNGSLNYQDMQDVFVINKEYNPNKTKNKNKLPDALIEKLIMYSSDEGDVVCDFFLGNFTTAIVAKKLGRNPVGFEINQESFEYWNDKFESIEQGAALRDLKVVENNAPKNQGKRVTEEELKCIICDFEEKMKCLKTKKEVMAYLCDKYGRGRFGIKNIIDKHYEK